MDHPHCRPTVWTTSSATSVSCDRRTAPLLGHCLRLELVLAPRRPEKSDTLATIHARPGTLNKLIINQVSLCWSDRTSDLNMTLLAFAAERRAAGRPPLSIDIFRPPGQQLQTRRTRCSGRRRTDRRTDTVSLHRPCRIVCKRCQ